MTAGSAASTYQTYDDEASPPPRPRRTGQGVRPGGQRHPECKLLLASGAANSSGMVGRNLMDHPLILTWGLMAEPVLGLPGPRSPRHRDVPGRAFRERDSAFRIEVGNGAGASPDGCTDPATMNTGSSGCIGRRLRTELGEYPRQFRLGLEMEQIPEESNYVTIDPAYRDQLGNYRPVIRYDLPTTSAAGWPPRNRHPTRCSPCSACSRASGPGERPGSRLPLRRDYTPVLPTDPGLLDLRGAGYTFQGAGHVAGTHRMGGSPRNFRGRPATAELGPPQPLPGRLRQHADRRHVQSDADDDRPGHLGRR